MQKHAHRNTSLQAEIQNHTFQRELHPKVVLTFYMKQINHMKQTNYVSVNWCTTPNPKTNQLHKLVHNPQPRKTSTKSNNYPTPAAPRHTTKHTRGQQATDSCRPPNRAHKTPETQSRTLQALTENNKH